MDNKQTDKIASWFALTIGRSIFFLLASVAVTYGFSVLPFYVSFPVSLDQLNLMLSIIIVLVFAGWALGALTFFIFGNDYHYEFQPNSHFDTIKSGYTFKIFAAVVLTLSSIIGLIIAIPYTISQAFQSLQSIETVLLSVTHVLLYMTFMGFMALKWHKNEWSRFRCIMLLITSTCAIVADYFMFIGFLSNSIILPLTFLTAVLSLAGILTVAIASCPKMQSMEFKIIKAGFGSTHLKNSSTESVLSTEKITDDNKQKIVNVSDSKTPTNGKGN